MTAGTIAMFVTAILTALMLIGTIAALWRLEFGPGGPTTLRWMSFTSMGLCAVILVFEWWRWRHPFDMATLALVALSQALTAWGRCRHGVSY